MNLITWLFGPGPAAAPEPDKPKVTPKMPNQRWVERQPVSGLDVGLRLNEWRQSEPMVSEMRRFLDTKFGRDVISCLVNECRVRSNLPEPNRHVVAIELGRIAGHQEAIDIMLLMGEHLERPVEIPITYPQPEAFKRED